MRREIRDPEADLRARGVALRRGFRGGGALLPRARGRAGERRVRFGRSAAARGGSALAGGRGDRGSVRTHPQAAPRAVRDLSRPRAALLLAQGSDARVAGSAGLSPTLERPWPPIRSPPAPLRA